MTYSLSVKSKMRLDGVHPDLVKVVKRVCETTDAGFFVLEGVRSLEQEKINFAKGASQTMNSRHLTGHAIDIGALNGKGVLSWDYPLYTHLSTFFMDAAKELGVDLEWGGNWKTLKDGGHFQLSWAKYPVSPLRASEHTVQDEQAVGSSSSQSPFEGGGSGG